MPEGDKENNWFLILVGGSCIFAILFAFYSYFFRKNYDFIVETKCDSSKEECFERDCTNKDDCPPNQLSTFKRFSLKARDYKYCIDEDCTNACETNQIKCIQVKCSADDSVGESCVSPETQNTEPSSNGEEQKL